MKKFKANRDLDITIKMAKEQGWEISTEAFDRGHDSIWLRDMNGEVEQNEFMPYQVLFNTTNGHFFVYTPFSGDNFVASHLSKELDDKSYFKTYYIYFMNH